jgi:AraC-like DNA-binding protein
MTPATIPWGGPLQLFNMGWFPLARRGPLLYRHDTYALHVHQYRGRVWIGDGAFTLAPGDFTLTPPHTPSRYELERDGEHWCVHFSPTPPGPERLSVPLHRPADASSAAQAQRLPWLAEMARRRDSSPLAREACESGVRELLLWLHFAEDPATGDAPGTRSAQALGELVALLERRYERDWSAKDLAAHTGLNADYLARQFHRKYGCTIAQFLLRRRVDAARHLLRSTTLRVKEIGAAVGLADPQKFNKDFRAIAGLSPTEYRLQTRS